MKLRHAFAVASLFGVPLCAGAASFDCAKAGTPVERMICADPAVSARDERMAEAYKTASARDPRVRQAQREWLLGTRDKCGTAACLAKAYDERLAALGKDGPACAVNAAALVGNWLNADESSEPFEEADFTSDQGFVSFVHHAPFVTGKWTLKACHVHIAGTGEGTDYDFTVIGFSRGRLSLKDESDGGAFVFRKTK